MKECSRCGLRYDEDDPGDSGYGDRCFECWWWDASVEDRVEAIMEKKTGPNSIAQRVSVTDDPEAELLSITGDPAESLHDRVDAEHILSGAVPVKRIIEAQVECPDCLEGEAFEIDSGTGDVSCMNCGRPMS